MRKSALSTGSAIVEELFTTEELDVGAIALDVGVVELEETASLDEETELELWGSPWTYTLA
jgi:hypothetical protein